MQSIRTKTMLLGGNRSRQWGVTLEWPNDIGGQAIIRFQLFDCRLDGARKLIATPLGRGWSLRQGGVTKLTKFLERANELMEVASK